MSTSSPPAARKGPTPRGLKDYFLSLEALFRRMRGASSEDRARLLQSGAPGTEDEIAFSATMRALYERAADLNKDGGDSFVRGMKISRTGSYLLATQKEAVIAQLFGDSPARSPGAQGRAKTRKGKKGLTADSRREMLTQIDAMTINSPTAFPALPGAAATPPASAERGALSALDVLKKTLSAPEPEPEAPEPAPEAPEPAPAPEYPQELPAGQSWADAEEESDA